MVTVNLDNKELEILIMSMKHCMEACKDGGKSSGCKDCETLDQVLTKFQNIKSA